MLEKLKKYSFVICGGDRRELELFHLWHQKGWKVKVVGMNNNSIVPPKKVIDLGELNCADILILPVWGINERGEVSSKMSSSSLKVSPYLIEGRQKRKLVLSGRLPSWLKHEIPANVRWVITSEDEELTLLHSILTAEGAILHAMKISDYSLQGNLCLVLGLGRCGTALALRLKGLGAKVVVVVRREESHALALNYNLDAAYYNELEKYLPEALFIFNTVPALVLPGNALKYIKQEASLLDLASFPGGVDLEASKRSGVDVKFLPGLPGKVAPKTAGINLDSVYSRLIYEHLDFLEGGEQ